MERDDSQRGVISCAEDGLVYAMPIVSGQGERLNNNSLLVGKTHSMGVPALRFLLLTLKLEVELLLALHYSKKVSRGFERWEIDKNSKIRD
jgi:hypothetical protein